jgi:hypothetical protein
MAPLRVAVNAIDAAPHNVRRCDGRRSGPNMRLHFISKST